MAINTFADFQTRVSRYVRRSDVYDGDIEGAMYDAIRWLEAQHNWEYMFVEEDITPDVGTPNFVGLANKWRSIRSIRIQLLQALPTDPLRFLTIPRKQEGQGTFTGGEFFLKRLYYWTDKVSKTSQVIHFSQDIPVAEGYKVLCSYYRQDSEISGTIALDDIVWFEMAPGILLRATLVELADLLRDDKVLQRAENYLQSRLPAFIEADLAKTTDGAALVMQPFSEENRDDVFFAHDNTLRG